MEEVETETSTGISRNNSTVVFRGESNFKQQVAIAFLNLQFIQPAAIII